MKTTAEKFLAGVVSIVLAIALIGLAACGEDDDDDEDSQRVITAAAVQDARVGDRADEINARLAAERAAAAEAERVRLEAEARQKALEAAYKATKARAAQEARGSRARSSVGRTKGGNLDAWVDTNCESSGNPQARSKSGKYWGSYQYEYESWIEDGGKPEEYGNPNTSHARQREVASNAPRDRWPNC